MLKLLEKQQQKEFCKDVRDHLLQCGNWTSRSRACVKNNEESSHKDKNKISKSTYQEYRNVKP